MGSNSESSATNYGDGTKSSAVGGFGGSGNFWLATFFLTFCQAVNGLAGSGVDLEMGLRYAKYSSTNNVHMWLKRGFPCGVVVRKASGSLKISMPAIRHYLGTWRRPSNVEVYRKRLGTFVITWRSARFGRPDSRHRLIPLLHTGCSKE